MEEDTQPHLKALEQLDLCLPLINDMLTVLWNY